MLQQIGSSMALSSWLLAQTRDKPIWIEQIFPDILNLGKAILILVVGWIVAAIAKNITRGLLKRTNIDNQIAAWIGGQQRGESFPIENWIAEGVSWIVIIFTLVAFLNALKLENVSQPLNSLLEEVTGFLPQILAAGILLAVAWLLATLTKMLVVRSLEALQVDERLNQEATAAEAPAQTQLSLSQTIGNALYWFIFLLFLPSILSALNLQGTLVPVQNLLNQILSILPNILAALLIGAVGWLIAQVIRRVVTNLLAATGANQIGERIGLSRDRGSQSLSWIIGTIVYVLVLIPVAIAALNALQITAISTPAIAMLNQVLNILPKLFAAAVILALAYIAGKFVADFVTNILTGIGFNNILQWLGFPSHEAQRPPREGEPIQATAQETVMQTEAETPARTPSELVGLLVLIAIMLVASLTAVDILQIEALKTVVGVILVIAGQVLVGAVIFGVGLYLANLAFNLIASSGTRQSRIVGQAARIAIIILVCAMSLQEMGIAPNIVNLAFGLLFGSIAVAIAIAFGIGSKDIAAEQLRSWLESLKND